MNTLFWLYPKIRTFSSPLFVYALQSYHMVPFQKCTIRPWLWNFQCIVFQLLWDFDWKIMGDCPLHRLSFAQFWATLIKWVSRYKFSIEKFYFVISGHKQRGKDLKLGSQFLFHRGQRWVWLWAQTKRVPEWLFTLKYSS